MRNRKRDGGRSHFCWLVPCSYPAGGSPAEGFYYVYTEALVRTVAAVAYTRGNNHVGYNIHSNFRCEYADVLPLGDVLR